MLSGYKSIDNKKKILGHFRIKKHSDLPQIYGRMKG